MRSTCEDRSAISVLDRTPCARIASLNCAPIEVTGLSAFIALCMTTDMSFQRTAASCESVIPTMATPLKTTLPPARPAGGASNWAIANSRVDLPQPDSPTMPMNSPRPRSKLTSSTALRLPCLVAYSTEMPLTCRIGSPVTGARPTSSASALDTVPPYRPQRRVADFVERVVEQGEGGAEDRDPEPGHQRPEVLAGRECLVVLRPVQHRSPAHRRRVAEADELQAGREEDVVHGGAQEGCHDQGCHGGDDLDGDDVDAPLAADPGRLQVVPAAQRQGLGSELPCAVAVAGDDEDGDQHDHAAVRQVGGDDQQQREARDDQQRVGDQVEAAVPDPAQVGGGDAHDD